MRLSSSLISNLSGISATRFSRPPRRKERRASPRTLGSDSLSRYPKPSPPLGALGGPGGFRKTRRSAELPHSHEESNQCSAPYVGLVLRVSQQGKTRKSLVRFETSEFAITEQAKYADRATRLESLDAYWRELHRVLFTRVMRVGRIDSRLHARAALARRTPGIHMASILFIQNRLLRFPASVARHFARAARSAKRSSELRDELVTDRVRIRAPLLDSRRGRVDSRT